MKKFLKQFLFFIILGILVNLIMTSVFKKRGLPKIEEREPIKNQNLLEATTYVDNQGRNIIKNPKDTLVLVNRERFLPEDYQPEDLVIPKVGFSFDGELEKSHLRKIAADSLENLFKAGEEEGIQLFMASGFRSYERQEKLFNYKVNNSSQKEAEGLIALPGQSEHQTGLAVDVTSSSVNLLLEEEFENTKEGSWLRDNSHKFGFIIRYPKDKEEITKYDYEPWHLRYVGVEASEDIYKKNITLEEYLGYLPKS